MSPVLECLLLWFPFIHGSWKQDWQFLRRNCFVTGLVETRVADLVPKISFTGSLERLFRTRIQCSFGDLLYLSSKSILVRNLVLSQEIFHWGHNNRRDVLTSRASEIPKVVHFIGRLVSVS